MHGMNKIMISFTYLLYQSSPTELENIIGKHPKVSEVCVVGVADPGGNVPRAFVKVNVGPEENKILLAEDIKNFANGNY